MFWLAIPALMVAAAANRRRIARTVEREYAARFPTDKDGIAEGAKGFSIEGNNGRALLMLHGAGDSPQSLRYLAQELNAVGYTVSVPLLPGHGRSPQAFAHVSAAVYHVAAVNAFRELRKTYKRVGVVGQSMGGAIGVRLANEFPETELLVLLAPYLFPPRDVRAAATVSWLWSAFTPYLQGRGEASVHDRSASEHNMAYGSFTPRALKALVETARTGHDALLRVTVPTLVVNSTEDNRIPRPLAEASLAGAGANVEVRWVSGCGHIITVDYCKAEVAAIVRAFLAKHAG